MNNDDKKLIKDEKIDNRKIQSFEYEKTAISDGNIVGTCELGTATIELISDTLSYVEVKGSWIDTIHGSFYVSKVEPVQEKAKIKLECYDIKYKLDTIFDSKLYQEIFPCTLMTFRNKIFDNCGVTYDLTPFPNSSLILDSLPYFEEGISNRNVISIIAQAGGCFVDTDKEDKFYFNYFTDTVYEVNDYQELTTEKNLTEPVNTVVLGRGDTEDNVYYPENIEPRVTFRIDNNYILDSQDDNGDKRYDTIKELYNHLVGTQYLVFNMKTNTMSNKLDIKLGDKVRYKDIWGNVIEAPIMKKKLVYLGGDASLNSNYSLEMSAEEIKETSTDFNYASTVENKLLKVERKADKANGSIEDIVEDINGLDSKVTLIEQSNKEILQTVTSVETKVMDNVEFLKVEFETNNLLIQVDGGNSPYEDTVYEVLYNVFYLKNKIQLTPTTEEVCQGINVEIMEDKIKFIVSKNISIPNIDNKYVFNFQYIDEKENVYNLSKTIIVSLISLKGGTVQSSTEPDEKDKLWYDTVNNSLKRYNGSEWVVVNNYDSDIFNINKSIDELNNLTKEDIQKLATDFETLKETLNTKFLQTNEYFEMSFNSLNEKINNSKDNNLELINDIKKYIKFEDGNIILGENTSDVKLKIENDRITINDGANPISKWQQREFNVEELHFDNFAFVQRGKGSLSFRKVGDN